jgi:hypothetical protein
MVNLYFRTIAGNPLSDGVHREENPKFEYQRLARGHRLRSGIGLGFW